MKTTITSPQNDRIKGVRRLRRAKERRDTGRTLLEGPRVIEVALAAGVVPEVIFIAEGDTIPAVDTEVVIVSDSVIDSIAPTQTPRGPVAVLSVPQPAPLQAKSTVVLWEVATPGNVGTLIRTAAGFGWNVARHRGADPWSPKVLRAGAGAHFSVQMSQVEAVDELRAAGLTPVATVSTGGVAAEAIDTDRPVALLVGNEAAGLPGDVVDAADVSLTIPMLGFESLNAAVAGSIAMYALSQAS